MTNYIYMGVSIDGYIAAPDGGIEWLDAFPNPEESDFGYGDFIAGIDALVMGRGSYEKVLTFGFWPYERPVFVLSRSLNRVEPHLAGQAAIVRGPLPALLERLRQQGFKNLYIDGGQTATSFLREDLIDEMIITTLPILLGDGIPLFGRFDNPLRFTLARSETFANSFIKRHYVRER